MPALDKLSIDTPEQVALDFTLASIGSRFLALSVDTIIQIAATLALIAAGGLVALVLQLTLPIGKQPWVLAVLVLGWFLIYSAYFAFFEAVWNGQTPGKRIVGIRVISVSGRPISVYESILRNVVRVADQLPGTYAVGILAIFITERSQRLGDLAAGTVVVHEHSASEREVARAYDAPAGSILHGASRLAPEEIAVIELFLHRRADLSPYGRWRSAEQIATRMARRLGSSRQGTSERFLEELVAEYRVSGRYR